VDLSAEHVRNLAQALGLDLTPEDLTEITHRLNGFLDALAPLQGLPLDTVEPVPAPPEPEASR
jgi:hypothetical protein